MPDRRKHRGPHPKDAKNFGDDMLESLRASVSELSWLLSRDYAIDAALKVVGDRHQLVARQRVAVRRAAASDEAVKRREGSEVGLDSVNESLVIDGFNLIVTIEAALSGGVLLKCRDGAIRDLASVHGSYRQVNETLAAIELIASVLGKNGSVHVKWLLDSPVSNSGRLATVLREYAEAQKQRWEVELRHDVDAALMQSAYPIVTSDSRILDGNVRWINLADGVIADCESQPWVVDLRT
ncbi:MAG: DUF434 domain-containing protein [Rhodothermales bacterium]